MSPDAPRALGADACPDAEQLAAYIDGALSPAERSDVEFHLAGCDACRDIVADAAGVPFEIPASPVVRPRRRAAWIVVGGGLLAAAAALLLFVQTGRQTPAELARSLGFDGSTRPYEPRLSLAPGYAAPPPVSRTTDSASREVPPDVRIAAARLEKAAGGSHDADTLYRAGLARLAIDDPAGAVDMLQRASDLDPTPARLSDLSAALIVQGSRLNDAALLARARELAARVVERDGSYLPALFNGALAAERAGDRAAAMAAWQRYLQADGASPWAQEARLHLDRLRQGS